MHKKTSGPAGSFNTAYEAKAVPHSHNEHKIAFTTCLENNTHTEANPSPTSQRIRPYRDVYYIMMNEY